jgi:hypothetical protein
MPPFHRTPYTTATLPSDTCLSLLPPAVQAAGWLQSLQEPPTPETEEYGISSFVYR